MESLETGEGGVIRLSDVQPRMALKGHAGLVAHRFVRPPGPLSRWLLVTLDVVEHGGGIDPHHATLELALSQHIVDHAGSDPAKLLPEVDLIILSAPVPAILTLLEQLPSLTPHPCIVMDLGSTKRLIVEAMSRLPERFDPIGGHPICGKEKLSLANAERTLYYAAPFLLTPLERTSARALSAAAQLIEALGARARILDPVEHDRILAATSHLPFLLSSALALSTPP